MEKKAVGKITHFFPKISVAVVELSADLKVGDTISIEGSSTNLQQAVASMQIEKASISLAKKGQAIGLKVNGPVHEGDVVYKIVA